jgi:hypothetical protein
MSRHAGEIMGGILASSIFLAGSLSFSTMAQGQSPPNFAPTPSVGWFAYSRSWIPPESGAGPVRLLPGYRHVTNNEFRLTGRQPNYAMGDPDSPILKPWASERIRKRNEMILSGQHFVSPHASCWPTGVPAFILQPMTRPMYIVQGPKVVVMIMTSFNDVRRIFLADKHSPNVKTSWHGESIGRYEGDTLVVDTIGIDERTFVDGLGTPHTKDLHVIERFRLIDGGKTLEAKVYVEDPGAFTMPWSASQRFRLFEEVVAQVPIERLTQLATPAEGPLTEAICAENPNSFFPGVPALPIPRAAAPDF